MMKRIHQHDKERPFSFQNRLRKPAGYSLGRRKGRRATRSGQFESLETRVALAADSAPAILGTVYVDADADGVVSPGESLEGVEVWLVRDDGDQAYDSATDTQVAMQVTDANGDYCFGELQPDAAYFIVRPQQVVDDVQLEQVVSLLLRPGRPGQVIDDFRTRQMAVALPPAPSSNESVLLLPDESEVIGRERDLFVSLDSGLGDVALRVDPFGLENLLEFNNAPGTTGTRRVTWDGVDGDGQNLSMGLNGRDLTRLGRYTGIMLRGGVDASGAETDVILRFYRNDAQTFSELRFHLPVTGGAASGYIFLPFEDFSGPVTPDDVDAIELLIRDGGEGTDGKIALIGAAGPLRFDIPEIVVADLSVTKTNDLPAVVPGQQITYRIDVSNLGPDSVTGAQVKDLFPANLTDIAFTSTVTGNASGNTAAGIGNINDSVDMEAGSRITYLVTGTVAEAATGTIVNQVSVAPPSGVRDPDVTNNTATHRDPIGTAVDLAISKDDGIREVRIGDLVIYRVVARNYGPVDIEGARILDVFPSELDNVSFTSLASAGVTGHTLAGADLIDDLVNMPANSVIEYTVKGVVSDRAIGTLANLAEIQVPDGFVDIFPENNTEADVDLIARELTDVAVTKSNGLAIVSPGQDVTYTIVVSNHGPSLANGVRVQDTFASSLTNVRYTSELFNGATGATSVGTGDLDDLLRLPAGSRVVYTVEATVVEDATGTLENTVTATVLPTDIDPGNNTATDLDVLTPQADLSVTKTNAVDSVRPGDELTYTIVVTNAGPSAVSAAQVIDEPPGGLIDLSYRRDQGGEITEGSGTIRDSVRLAAGESITYTLTGTVAAEATGSLVNSVTVTPPVGIVDPRPGNNLATETDQVQRSTIDVLVRKSSSDQVAVPGQDIQYTIWVANVGTTTAGAAQVVDEFPGLLTDIRYTSEVFGDASGNSATGTGRIDDTLMLAPGASVVYTVDAHVASASTGVLRNLVSVELQGQTDVNPANNFDLNILPLVPHADLSVSKSNGVDSAEVGETLTYDIHVTNSGPSDVRGVVLREFVPAGLVDVTLTVLDGAPLNPAPIEGDGYLQLTFDLAAGETTHYRVTGVVSSHAVGVLANRVTVRGPLETGFIELDPSNNQSTDVDPLRSLVVLGSEPTVSLRDRIDTPGTTDQYQITAHQTGKMIVTTHFQNALGNLLLRVHDRQGDLIARVDTNEDREQLVLPVVGQETYLVVIEGTTGEEVNSYDLEIENFPAPVPHVVRLTPETDSGMMNDDAVTANPEPVVVVQADLAEFLSMGIPFLQPGEPKQDNGSLPLGPGVAVEVTWTDVSTGVSQSGYASTIGAPGRLFQMPLRGSEPLGSGDYVVTAAVRVFDGASAGDVPQPATARSPLSEPFWITVDRDAPAAAERPDLLEASDSGSSSEDDVTRINAPALRGSSEPNAKVRVYARSPNGSSELVGAGQATTSGTWEITVEPLSDGQYAFHVEYEDIAGNVSSLGESRTIEIDTVPPNTPYLDLFDASDLGVSWTDEITSDATPRVSMTTQDPEQSDHGLPFNYRYRIFIRPNAGESLGTEILVYDSSVDVAIPTANRLNGLTDLERLVTTLPSLPDGVHNLKLEVEDRAGNISEDFLLTITVDTTPPLADLAMATVSDSGIAADDRVTNSPSPLFHGRSEVGTLVSLYAGTQRIAQATVGSDASDGQIGDGLGRWEVVAAPLSDGDYEITAEFEDVAGNSSVSEPLSITIDTLPPNVPLIDLLTDSGRNDQDNVTRENRPTISITANATPDGGTNPYPHDVRYRVYDRPGDADGEVLLLDSYGAFQGMTEGGFFVEVLPMLSDGLHDLKVELEDRAGNVSHAYLLNVLIDTQPPESAAFVISAASDSGMFPDDFVTRVDSPSLTGISSVGDFVRVFAGDQLVGSTQVDSDESDGLAGDGLGAWQVTTTPLIDGVHDLRVEVEDLAGNLIRSDVQTLSIDTTRPNIPLLDLVSDSGRSETDNITNVMTPTVTITVNDTPEGQQNPFPNDVKFRLYDRSGTVDEILLVDSFVELGGFTSQGFHTLTLPELADGVHNLKLEVEDRAGNISLPFLLEITIDTSLPSLTDVMMAEYSDSGMSSTDRVTNILEPTFLGTGTAGDTILLFAGDKLVGQGVVNGDATDGSLGNGLGAWEVSTAPLDDGVYTISAAIEDVAGNVSSAAGIRIEIDTLSPNTPFLDLLEAHDSGRHNDDRITNAQDLVFTATTTDPNGANHLQLFPEGQNLKYRVYARPEEETEVLVYDSTTDERLVDRLDGLTAALRIVTNPLTFPEGLHNLKLEVEDRAGNISQDFLTDLLIDRTPFLGQAKLAPGSDSGVLGVVSSLTDGITNVRTPIFTGAAEANALVTMTIDGMPAGTAVAIPVDGDDAVQPPTEPYPLDGNWFLASTIALSDGIHQVVFQFEDPAGNRMTTELEVIVDTSGPQITNVTRNELGYASLFDPKPSSGPDPLIGSIVIHVRDRFDAAVNGDNTQTLSDIVLEEGHYQLVGDASGNIPVVQVELLPSDLAAGWSERIVLTFAQPLPDDRYTLTVDDAITDVAGNRLDGESGARAPFEGTAGSTGAAPVFPTGDGVAGGNFVARFTVDSRPELATWASGSVWVDTNGNSKFDPDQTDYVNRDIVYRFGFTSDDLFAGNFALRGRVADGFDKLAAYGRAEGEFRWLVDTDNDGVPNIDRVDPFQANGLPVAGRFDTNADNGDEVGLFDGQFWYFDTNHDFLTDTKLRSSLVGYPIVGDFDGDGFDDLATWTDNRFMIDLARGSARGWDGYADQYITFGFTGVRERPVVADLDQDGFDDLGLWVPDREGVTDRDQSEWYFLISNGESLFERLSPPDDPIDSRPVIDFTPVPFGPDLYARYGDEFAIPLVGNFDPPVVPVDNGPEDLPWTNPNNPLDVNGDASVSPLDALLVINQLNGQGARRLPKRSLEMPFLDVNGDQFISPMDALFIVNELNRLNHVVDQTATPLAAVAAVPVLAADQLWSDDPHDSWWQDETLDQVSQLRFSEPSAPSIRARRMAKLDLQPTKVDDDDWDETLLQLADDRRQLVGDDSAQENEV